MWTTALDALDGDVNNLDLDDIEQQANDLSDLSIRLSRNCQLLALQNKHLRDELQSAREELATETEGKRILQAHVKKLQAVNSELEGEQVLFAVQARQDVSALKKRLAEAEIIAEEATQNLEEARAAERIAERQFQEMEASWNELEIRLDRTAVFLQRHKDYNAQLEDRIRETGESRPRKRTRAGMNYEGIAPGHIPILSRVENWRRGVRAGTPTDISEESIIPSNNLGLRPSKRRRIQGPRAIITTPTDSKSRPHSDSDDSNREIIDMTGLSDNET